MVALWIILTWIAFGLVVGALARFLLPGRQSMSLVMTIVLGVAGSFVGGFISSLITEGQVARFHASHLIWSIVGAVVLLVAYSWMQKKT
jgi:uncharacterized membrane protein YeaQ/YmgE (transglycosylase-associated protein family)